MARIREKAARSESQTQERRHYRLLERRRPRRTGDGGSRPRAPCGPGTHRREKTERAALPLDVEPSHADVREARAIEQRAKRALGEMPEMLRRPEGSHAPRGNFRAVPGP